MELVCSPPCCKRTEFKVFYRFDDAAQAIGTSGVTNAVPFGNSIRTASDINALAGTVDPWNYVVR